MQRFSLLVAFALFLLPSLAAEPMVPALPPEGILPVGADGKPLNLDFETGTLKDWKAEGAAFVGQPIKGDTVFKRRGDMHSQHQGNYWIGGYELKGDKPQGTLTSVPFKVTHPWASFLVGGGASPATCVELVRKDSGDVLSRNSGLDDENMHRVAIELRPHLGKEIFIRLVDKHSGGWGHINFDDFRFHADKPNVPSRDSLPGLTPPGSPDVYKYAGLTPEKAAAAMTVPEGFTVSLFAGEPDVCQPIAMCFDDRGRLWVAEAYSYPIRRPDKEAKDRILIFEDSKGTGHFDKRTVFMEGLNLVSGMEVGFGGVWIGAAPYLMFVPIKPGEDKPAGAPKILLDGWHYEDTHETLNTFTWGPDGWLYGCHGVFTHSRVGKPGTPDKDRIPINAGVWRYHPTKHVFEVFAHGTSNPWGLDFDEHGQAFVEACVIPHAFHIIQGGRYQRQAGSHFNPYTYADIQTIADHLHWQGKDQWAGNASSSSVGGGHAHAGLMIYQGGAWPKEFNGKMFMGNIHGHRINMDVLKPKGSGFVASHGPDFLLANDAWARFINMRYGPDGNVYLIDWYDKQACHHHDPNVWDRDNGRIYKVSYRGTEPVHVDLTRKTDKELIELLLHKNEWFVRHAQRLLQERVQMEGRKPGELAEIHNALAKIAFEHKNETRRLRGLWALHVTGGLTEQCIEKLLSDAPSLVRAWTIQLACEGPASPPKSCIDLLQSLAWHAPPVVRLYIAAALQRPALAKLSLLDRGKILNGLFTHPEDFDDHNLRCMYWYALEPLAARDPKLALSLETHAARRTLLPWTAQRITSLGTKDAMNVLVTEGFGFAGASDAERQKALMQGMQEGLRGRRQVDMPTDWPDIFAVLSVSKDAEVRRQAMALAVTFGDTKAFAALRRILSSGDADLSARQSALTALLGARDKELPPVLHTLIKDPALRGAAIRGLATYDDPKTPAVILAEFPSLTAAEKRDALNTLASRAVYGKALMEAIAAKKVPASDVPAEIVRQLRNLKDKELDKRIGELWGIVRTTPADRAKMIGDFRRMLSYNPVPPDLSYGRAIFAKTCQQCHTLYGVGGKVGPDITGSNRADLNYLLENILDPSAVIPNDYKATKIDLKNGRVVTGIIRGDNGAAYTVITANETLTIPKNEVDELTPSNTSMMPDDLLKPLTETDVRALVGYLRHTSQVPIMATADNAKDLFNGKDLTGWDGDPKLWTVENGEIVGKSPGIKKNEFLKSQMIATDFRLTIKVKLVPNKENSGVQFRSEALPDGEMKGPQADVGAGWWGKLYEENGRGAIWDKSGEKHVKVDDWNEYVVVAEGSRVKTYINGQLCVELDDPAIARRGIFALQIHAGGPMEVRFKDVKLEVLPAKK